jgi:hypothetical protein
MMASLGKFGVAHPVSVAESVTTFDWFDRTQAAGNPIRVIADVNQVELIDFMETVRGIDAAALEAMVVVKDGFRLLLNPDDFDDFWRLAKVNRQEVDDLVEVFMVLVSRATDRPTSQPSTSSTGRLPTSVNLPEDSSTPVSSGRPDLQLLVEDSAADRARILSAIAG